MEQAAQAIRRVTEQTKQSEMLARSSSRQLAQIIRAYLQTEFDVTASALTPGELASRLHGPPHMDAVLDLLQRCDILKYQAAPVEETAMQALWEEALTMFEHIDQEEAA